MKKLHKKSQNYKNSHNKCICMKMNKVILFFLLYENKVHIHNIRYKYDIWHNLHIKFEGQR